MAEEVFFGRRRFSHKLRKFLGKGGGGGEKNGEREAGKREKITRT